jgi:hypothetical protein
VISRDIAGVIDATEGTVAITGTTAAISASQNKFYCRSPGRAS